MKIYHAADIHLGRRRLDGRLPDQDMAAAFRFIVEEAVREKADVFLLAGDLFDRPQVEPPHLRQAQEILQLLKRARIPVIAIEGNHDRQFVNTEVTTWVKFLAEDDLLMLLSPDFSAEGAGLKPWDAQSRSGAWIDIDGVRFVGAGYLGAATPHKVRQLARAMVPGKTQVLLLHAGPEYFVGEGGGFGKEDLELLKTRICYLALGHIHKPMIHDGWACNPGSPENCDLREAAFSRNKSGEEIGRGYAVLEIAPGQKERPVKLEIRSNPRRPTHRLELDCSPFGGKTKNGAAAFSEAAVSVIRGISPTADAIVELVLLGNLNLNRIALDQAGAAMEIAGQAGVFAVSIDATRLNIGSEFGAGQAVSTESMPRDELERRAILELVGHQPLWGLRDHQQSFADLFYQLKEAVHHEQSGEAIASLIGASPLVEKVRLAASAPKEKPKAELPLEPAAAAAPRELLL